jgi:hypothetical protein
VVVFVPNVEAMTGFLDPVSLSSSSSPKSDRRSRAGLLGSQVDGRCTNFASYTGAGCVVDFPSRDVVFCYIATRVDTA